MKELNKQVDKTYLQHVTEILKIIRNFSAVTLLLFFKALKWLFIRALSGIKLFWQFLKFLNRKPISLLIALVLTLLVSIPPVVFLKMQSDEISELKTLVNEQEVLLENSSENSAMVYNQLEGTREQLYLSETENKQLREKLTEKEIEEAKKNEIKKGNPSAFVSSYRNGQSPIKNYVEWFYVFGGEEKGEIALAIAGNETGFGIVGDGVQYYNAWGYMCGFGGIRHSCGWETLSKDDLSDFINANGLNDKSIEEVRWIYAISRYIEVADNYLSKYDGSRESISSIAYGGYFAPGMDGAKQEHVENWISNIHWFTQNL